MRNLKRVLALAMAMVMVLGMMVIGSSAASYTDSAAIDADYAEAVEVLTGMGVFKGQGTGFAPKATLTRAEAATLIYRVITADVTDAKVSLYDYSTFADVAEGNWATGYITYAANGGYVKGDGTGNFLPNAQVTGVQVLAIMLRAMGYGQKGEFEGAAWKDNVLTTAHDLGLLENVKANDLDKPATREIVAQLIWDALWAPTTTYTPAFGYWPSAVTLGDKFGLDVTDFEYDAFMRPSYGYTYNTGDKATMWPVDPVAEFTTKVTDCDMTAAVGVKTSWTADIYTNGVLTYDNETIVATATTTPVDGTAQGTLTQVFNLGTAKAPVWHITEIETWLAKVTDVKVATFDKAGHLKTPNKTDFDVFGGDDINDYNTADYAKNSYVLLTWSGKDNDKIPGYQAIGLVDITPVTPVDTAKLVAYNSVIGVSTVGANTYNWAAKYALNNPGTVGSTYEVYCDLYGNVIGLAVPASAAAVYGILDKGIQVTNGWTPYYLASLITTDGTNVTAADIAVKAYTDRADFAAALGVDGHGTAKWPDNAVCNVNHIVSYVSTPAGYILADAADGLLATGGYVKTGFARIYDPANAVQAVTDAETVYVIETAEGVFSTYTGYTNVPSINTAKHIEWVTGANGYVDLVYINAIGATYAGSATYAYVHSATYAKDIGDGVLANGAAYDVVGGVVINGEVTTIKVAKAYTTTFLNSGVYNAAVNLKYDANGLVIGHVGAAGTMYRCAKNNSGAVVYLTDNTSDPTGTNASDKGYIVDAESTVWVIDTTNGLARIGTADDFKASKWVNAVVDVDTQTVVTALIFTSLAD